MANSWDGRRVRGAIPGHVGGLSTSKAKQRAARENGRLGGRPKNASKLQRAEAEALEMRQRAQAAEERARALETELAAAKAKAEPAPNKRPAPTVDRFGLIEID